MKIFLESIRFKSQIKNFVIFLPFIFSGKILNTNNIELLNHLIYYFYFSFFTMVVYLFNDIFDYSFDSQHPIKKERPLASGRLLKKNYYRYAIYILIFIFLINLQFSISNAINTYILIYLINNILYTVYFKRFQALSTILIGVGFVIRILIGLEVSGLNFSSAYFLVLLVFFSSTLVSYIKKKFDFNFNEAQTNFYKYKFIQLNLFSLILIYFLHLVEISFSIFDICKSIMLFSFVLVYALNNFNKRKYFDPVDLIIKSNFLKILIFFWLFDYLFVRYF